MGLIGVILFLFVRSVFHEFGRQIVRRERESGCRSDRFVYFFENPIGFILVNCFVIGIVRQISIQYIVF